MEQRILLILAMVCLEWGLVSKVSPQGKPKTAESDPKLVYDAFIERFQGLNVQKGRLLCSGERFRCEIEMTRPDGRGKSIATYVYDNSQPPVVWGYDEKRSAWPSSPSCDKAIADAMVRYGEAETQRRFGVPARYLKIARLYAGHKLRPDLHLLTRKELDRLAWKKVGREKVAGVLCEALQGKWVAPGTGGSVRVTIEQKAWVEPRTGLVLRWESRYANPPAPPFRQGYVVKRLRFLKSVPPDRFQLPPGSTANVPEIFQDVRLPPGVRRVKATGAFAKTGKGF